MTYREQWSRPGYWFVAVPMLLLVLAIAAVTPIITDEWWGNLVVERVARGDALYGDVFYGSPPFAVVLGLAARLVPAPELITLRLVNVTAAVVLLVVMDAALHRAGRGTLTRIAAVGTVSLLVVPAAMGQIYSAAALALAFGSIMLIATGRTRWTALAAGALAGMSCGVKSNIGLVAMAVAIALAIIAGAAGERGRRALESLVGMGGALLLTTVLPVMVIGDPGGFLQQAILGRRDYVAAGGVTATGPLHELLLRALVGRPDLILADPGMLLLLLSGVVAVIGLLLIRRSTPAAPVLLGLFACAVASVLPRPDWMHLGVASPGMVVALIGIPVTWPEGIGRRMAALLGPVVVATCGAGLLGSFIVGLPTSGPQSSLVADAGGGFLRDPEATRVASDVVTLKEVIDRPVFIVSGSAPRLYQLGRFANATRFDYPYTSNFTAAAQQEVIASIESGQVPLVCITDMSGGWAPTAFLDYVRAHMRPVLRTAACDLYVTGA